MTEKFGKVVEFDYGGDVDTSRESNLIWCKYRLAGYVRRYTHSHQQPSEILGLLD